MIQFKYYNEGATFDASLLNNEDIAFVEDENALYTHGKKFKFVDEVTTSPTSPTPEPPGLFARLITNGPPSYLVNFSGKALRFRTNTGYHTYICDVLADHYTEEPTIPQEWEYVDVDFNGDNIKNGSFVYDGIEYVCADSVLTPKVDQVYEG